MLHVKHMGEYMKANYVDIALKYMTWYKDVTIEVINETVYGLPILKVTDHRMNTFCNIYYVEDILNVFRWIGQTRKAYGRL